MSAVTVSLPKSMRARNVIYDSVKLMLTAMVSGDFTSNTFNYNFFIIRRGAL